MHTDQVELVDLGDATKETRQFVPLPVFLDNAFFLALFPDLG